MICLTKHQTLYPGKSLEPFGGYLRNAYTKEIRDCVDSSLTFYNFHFPNCCYPAPQRKTQCLNNKKAESFRKWPNFLNTDVLTFCTTALQWNWKGRVYRTFTVHDVISSGKEEGKQGRERKKEVQHCQYGSSWARLQWLSSLMKHSAGSSC